MPEATGVKRGQNTYCDGDEYEEPEPQQSPAREYHSSVIDDRLGRFCIIRARNKSPLLLEGEEVLTIP